MPWRTLADGKIELCISIFDIVVDPLSGKGELRPGPFYSSLDLSPNDPNIREAAIRSAYEVICRFKAEFEKDATEEGVVLE